MTPRPRSSANRSNSARTTSKRSTAVRYGLALTTLAVASVSVAACGEDASDVAPTTTAASGEPTTTTTTTLPPYESPVGDIIGEALVAGKFTTLAALLVQADLVEALRGDGPFTVFAPLDSAFTALPAATLDAVYADNDLLTAVLTYHVVAGETLALADLSDGTVLTTLQGGTLTIAKSGDQTLVNGIPVVMSDVNATNGVIHVISGVLVPG
ncbi:MAG: fasciclin domain-containing protein [Ilumatobacteraceae bacterium]